MASQTMYWAIYGAKFRLPTMFGIPVCNSVYVLIMSRILQPLHVYVCIRMYSPLNGPPNLPNMIRYTPWSVLQGLYTEVFGPGAKCVNEVILL